jgi:hypothetical protein
MALETPRLRRLAPFLVPVAILIAGWALLVRPAAAERTRIVGRLAEARARAAAIQAEVSESIPPPSPGNALGAFQQTLASGDATAAVIEQLARLASSQLAGELMIETGPHATVEAPSNGPQAVQAAVDARLHLFEIPLTYSPITMAFETEYPQVGQFLWGLRDLATIVEIRKVEITPQPERVRPMLHVSLTLFAFARAAARPGGAL